MARAFVEGQAQSRGKRIAELEVILSLKEEGLKITETAATGKWFLPISLWFCFALCGL
jgi:hypothetical protein